MKYKLFAGFIFFAALTAGYISNWPFLEPVKVKPAAPEQQLPVAEMLFNSNKPQQLEVNFDAFFAGSDTRKKGIELVEPGEGFDLDGVTVTYGKKWFGFFNNNGESTLRETTVTVKESKEGLTDIQVRERSQPMFLVRGTKNLRAGKITSVYYKPQINANDAPADESNVMYNGFVKDLKLGEKSYRLLTEKGIDKSGKEVLVLQLETGGVKQPVTMILYSSASDYAGKLLWAGDLDGDSKLDLYINFFGYEKGYDATGLFLSSEAESGKLLSESAGFTWYGC